MESQKPVKYRRRDSERLLQEKGEKRTGKAAGGRWEKQIEGTAFRPEVFLRKITLITGGDR